MTTAPSSRSSGNVYSGESSATSPDSTPGSSFNDDPEGDSSVAALDLSPEAPRRRCPTLPVCLRREWRSFSPSRPTPLAPSLPARAGTDILDCFPSPPSHSTPLSKLYMTTTTTRVRAGSWAEEVLEEAEECVDRVRWLEEWWRIKEVREVKGPVCEGRRTREDSLPAMARQVSFAATASVA